MGKSNSPRAAGVRGARGAVVTAGSLFALFSFGGLLVAASSLLGGSAVAADLSLKDTPAPAYYYSEDDIWTRQYLFGDLGRTRLAEEGITIWDELKNEAVANLSGGDKTGGANAGQLAVGAKFDMYKLAGIQGGTAGITLVDRWGRNLNGDDNIPAIELTNEVYGRGNIVRLTEFYYDQKFFDGWLELKGGRLPVGSDFFFQKCEFTNLTFCGGQPGNILGSYIYNWPVSQWAGIVKFNLPAHFQLEVGFYDANPNYLETKPSPALFPTFAPSYNGPITPGNPGAGTLIPVELNWKPGFGGLDSLWKIGGWYDTADAVTLATGKVESGLSGGYVSIWQQLTSPGSFKDAPDPKHGLFTFFNVSVGDHRTSIDDYEVAWGLQQIGGFFASRPDDQIAFAVGTNHVNTTAGGPAAGKNEYPLEAWYGWQVAPWLNLRFDLQYIVNPGGFEDGVDPAIKAHDNVVVVGLRTIVKF